MAKDIVLLLIGSLLSLAGVLLSRLLENNQRKQERRWKLEDKENEILNHRLNQAEEYANKQLAHALEIQKAIYLLHLHGKNPVDVLEELQKHSDFMGDTLYLITPMMKLDKTICDKVINLGDLNQYRVNELYTLWNKKQQGEQLNIQEFLIQTKQFTEKVKLLHMEIITRLDDIRKFSLPHNAEKN